MFLTKASFCYETTLSSHQAIRVLQRAQLAGYHTQLLFVSLVHPDLHVQRVRDRVMKQGHDIPEETVRRRYDISFQNLTTAIPLCHEVAVVDNSYPSGPVVRVELLNGRITRNGLSSARQLDRRIAGCVAMGLNLPIANILPIVG
jgi:predicted ABC-type ATPase